MDGGLVQALSTVGTGQVPTAAVVWSGARIRSWPPCF